MSKYFCLYCEPDLFGNHEEYCIMAKKPEQDKVLEDYGKILKEINRILERDNDVSVDEMIEKLKNAGFDKKQSEKR